MLALAHITVDGESHMLGRGGVKTVPLTPTKDLPRFDRCGAGLFHTAVLSYTQRVEDDGGELTFADPWGSGVRARVDA